MIPSATRYDLSSPKTGVPNAFREETSRRVLPSGEHDRRYWQGSCVLCRISLWAERCRLLPNYFGRCFLVIMLTCSVTVDMFTVGRDADSWPSHCFFRAPCVFTVHSNRWQFISISRSETRALYTCYSPKINGIASCTQQLHNVAVSL